MSHSICLERRLQKMNRTDQTRQAGNSSAVEFNLIDNGRFDQAEESAFQANGKKASEKDRLTDNGLFEDLFSAWKVI